MHSRLEVLQTAVTSEGFYTAELVCHSCRDLGLESGNDKAKEDTWIYSANPDQKMQTDSVHKVILMHRAYGKITECEFNKHADIVEVNSTPWYKAMMS